MTSETNERLARIEEALKYQGGDIDKLATAVEKLAGALINKELFNELQNDVRDYIRKTDRLEERTKTNTWLIRTWIGVVALAIGVIVTRLLDLL